MELWIRSQDKKKLYNVKNLELDNLETGIFYESRDNFVLLGKYKSKERALEVLDEIQTLLKPKVLLNSGKILGSFEDTIYKEPDKVEIQELNTIVYEMPKE